MFLGMASKPLQEPAFLILSALAAGPLHGYAIIAETERMSEGRVSLKVGTLYAALDRLAADGLVAHDRDEVVDGRHRRYLKLTDEGAERLGAEARRIESNARAALSRLKARTA